MRNVCLILCLFFGGCAAFVAPLKISRPPKFSNQYVATGVIKLPYAEIEEPFSAWYDSQNGRSRIDYYSGMVKTYQRADLFKHGVNYKIEPITTEEVTNAISCFASNGSLLGPVSVQSIIPDLFGFKYSNDEVYNGVDCSKWVKIEEDGGKINKYSIWISTDNKPVHYEMKGYDSLLGSHYDKYEVDYSTYETTEPDISVFEIPESITCGDFPGTSTESNSALHNPISEFIDNNNAHVHQMFEDFKTTHGKEYNSVHEHETRKNIFRQNLRYIHSTNRQGLTYRLKPNHLADRTDHEMRRMRGRLPTKGYNGGLPFRRNDFPSNFPDSVDWRLYGAVTPVKDQAICGSCWSFGSLGTVEGAYFLKTRNLIRLSEQSLVDCSWGFENNGCDGGFDFRAYQWIMKHGGVPIDDSYGPYLGEDGYCHAENATKAAIMTGYVNVTAGDIEALQVAIANIGPVSVSIDASQKDFSFYSSGVYSNSQCKKLILDHSVLAVGYGTLNGQDYWLIKNSWSTYWGNDGYILISRTNNICGVATEPTYVLLADEQPLLVPHVEK